MSDRAQALGQQHEELLKQALSQPGVAMAMQVFENAQGSVAMNQYAIAASTVLMSTMPATHSAQF
ncbi:MAG: hypothetical protein P4L81_02815 [Candidatus Pacebacteria bacterium]|nr:hypothetical protein [Candidatus Paceibacterota bacterium]